MRKLLSGLIVILLCCMSAVAAVWLFDRFMPEPPFNHETNFAQLVLHPYSGFHNIGVPANQRASTGEVAMYVSGRAHREGEDTVRVLGFADSVDVTNPLPKPANEVRVLIIGGSGAQGQGGPAGSAGFPNRFEAKLEEWLNTKLEGNGWHTRFINMAMGGSISYQNFIQLNRWGHALQPDAIISYSGRNDLWVPHYQGHDGYHFFDQVNYLVTLRDTIVRDDDPPLIKSFAKHLPRLYHHTLIPFYVKSMFYGEHYKVAASNRYRAQIGYDRARRSLNHENTATTIAAPQQAHALKSIKRDFLGIPIVLAWQHASRPEVASAQLSEGTYDGMFDAISEAVKGYCNDDWFFLNTHAIIRDKNDPSLGGAHLSRSGHELLAKSLLDPMTTMVNTIIERRKAGQQPPLNCADAKPGAFIPAAAKVMPSAFDNWVARGVALNGGFPAPDGSAMAARIEAHKGIGPKHVTAMGQIDLPRKIIAGVHARQGEGRILLFTAADGRPILSCDVDLKTGRATVRAPDSTQEPKCSTTPADDGWWKIEMTGSPQINARHVQIGVSPTHTPFTNDYDAQSPDPIYAWKATIHAQ